MSKLKKKKPSASASRQMLDRPQVNYVCVGCEETERIPLGVVQDFDRMDDGDPVVPPQFVCQQCGGEVYPEYYKGVRGYEYKVSGILEIKKDRQGILP